MAARFWTVPIALLAFAGCSSYPVDMEATMVSSETLDEAVEGESMTVAYRVFQLKSIDPFMAEGSTFVSLWEDPKETLGDSLVAMHEGDEFSINPDEEKGERIKISIQEATKFVGVMGLFQSIDPDNHDEWRCVVPVDEFEDATFRFEEFKVWRELQ